MVVGFEYVVLGVVLLIAGLLYLFFEGIEREKRARQVIPQILRSHGELSGKDLCEALKPHARYSGRAFYSLMSRLVKEGAVVRSIEEVTSFDIPTKKTYYRLPVA